MTGAPASARAALLLSLLYAYHPPPNPLLAPLPPYSAEAFAPSPVAPRRTSPGAPDRRRFDGGGPPPPPTPPPPSPSALQMGASLRVVGGGEEIEVGPEGAKLDGCVVEESGGRYYCTAEDGAGGGGAAASAAVSIGGNALTAGVRYLLNEGMVIRTGDGEGDKEYEVKIEGGAAPSDPALAMMFGVMKAGFANADEEGSPS